MEGKPIEVLVEEYKKLDQHFVGLLILVAKTLPPSIARKYFPLEVKEQERQRAKIEYQRKGGDREFKAACRRRADLRQAITALLAQHPTWETNIDRVLEAIGEYVEVRRKTETNGEELGKIPRAEGKVVRALLLKWFGRGTYELEYVRDGDRQDPIQAKV